MYIINFKDAYFTSVEKESEDYIFLLKYNKDNNGIYNLYQILFLVKKYIRLNEISYVSYKHFENEDNSSYCIFYFNSLIKYSETNYIISFKSEIKAERNQYNYYVDDDNYSNETCYYNLDINNGEITKIFSKDKQIILNIDEKNKQYYYLCLKFLLFHYKIYYHFRILNDYLLLNLLILY